MSQNHKGKMSVVIFVYDFPKLENQVCFLGGKYVYFRLEVNISFDSCFCSLALPTVRLIDKYLTRFFKQTICSVLIARTRDIRTFRLPRKGRSGKIRKEQQPDSEWVNLVWLTTHYFNPQMKGRQTYPNIKRILVLLGET